MKTFNVEIETEMGNAFQFAGDQKKRFTEYKCERVFVWAYMAGNIRRLPKYVTSAILSAGYAPVYIGGTTYSHSVIGLIPTNNISQGA